MLYLMSLAGYKPVIEYCGGTELGGGYIGAHDGAGQRAVHVLHALVRHGAGVCRRRRAQPAGSVSRAAGNRHVDRVVAPRSSRRVLSRRAARARPAKRYAATATRCCGLPGGYYRALGRTDDTMNLGGIKVSSVEIERAANMVDGISETAAIAVTPPDGGPSQLWLFAVLNADCRLEVADLKRQAAKRDPAASESAVQDPQPGADRVAAAHRLEQDHASSCCATRLRVSPVHRENN